MIGALALALALALDKKKKKKKREKGMMGGWAGLGQHASLRETKEMKWKDGWICLRICVIVRNYLNYLIYLIYLLPLIHPRPIYPCP